MDIKSFLTFSPACRLPFYLFIHPTVCLHVHHLSICPSLCLSAHPSITLAVSLSHSVCLFITLHSTLSVCPFLYPFVCLNVSPSIQPCICQTLPLSLSQCLPQGDERILFFIDSPYGFSCLPPHSSFQYHLFTLSFWLSFRRYWFTSCVVQWLRRHLKLAVFIIFCAQKKEWLRLLITQNIYFK